MFQNHLLERSANPRQRREGLFEAQPYIETDLSVELDGV
jgi:hypothetical protein